VPTLRGEIQLLVKDEESDLPKLQTCELTRERRAGSAGMGMKRRVRRFSRQYLLLTDAHPHAAAVDRSPGER